MFQTITQEIESNRSLYQKINHIGHELIVIDPEELTSEFLPVLDCVNTSWQTVTVEILSHSRSFNELIKCSEKFYGIKEPLELWLDEVEANMTSMDPIAVDIEVIERQINEQKVLAKLMVDFLYGCFSPEVHLNLPSQNLLCFNLNCLLTIYTVNIRASMDEQKLFE